MGSRLMLSSPVVVTVRLSFHSRPLAASYGQEFGSGAGGSGVTGCRADPVPRALAGVVDCRPPLAHELLRDAQLGEQPLDPQLPVAVRCAAAPVNPSACSMTASRPPATLSKRPGALQHPSGLPGLGPVSAGRAVVTGSAGPWRRRSLVSGGAAAAARPPSPTRRTSRPSDPPARSGPACANSSWSETLTAADTL